MNTFEIVRGVEGDCLVLDGTRICGPKPWGGGRIIKTFRTDGIYEVIDKYEYRKLVDDNAKLRELCAGLLTGYECGYGELCKGCTWDGLGDSKTFSCLPRAKARELGVEVDA